MRREWSRLKGDPNMLTMGSCGVMVMIDCDNLEMKKIGCLMG